MTDIARLGFTADTAALKEARADLQAIQPAADRAAKSTDNFNRAAAGVTRAGSGAAAGIKSFESAVMGAASGTGRLSKSALGAGTAMGTVQRAAMGAANSINNLTVRVTQSDAHVATYRAHIASLAPALASVAPAATGATSALNRLGAAANDNINRMQATPGNIAAQFQDIGVTAAAGMSPMIIALQQGTQLSAAMSGGIGNLARAFAQIFSPMALLTIGIVGVVAALIQMVDWVKVGQTLLYGAADAIEKFATAAAYMGAVLLVAFAPQILALVTSLAATIAGALFNAIVSATGAMIAFAIANPFTALVIAIGIVIGAMMALNDTFGGVFTDILANTKSVANFLIGAFVTAYNTIKATWRQLPAAIGDVAIMAANATLTAVENMVNGTIARINGLVTKLPFGLGKNLQMGNVSFGKLGNPYAGTAAGVGNTYMSEAAKTRGVDYVGQIGGAIRKGASWLGGKMRGFAAGLGAAAGKGTKGAGGKTDNAATGGKTDGEKFDDIVKGADQRIAALRAQIDQVGQYGLALEQAKQMQTLLNEATSKGIVLDEAQKKVLADKAKTLATLSEELRHATFMENNRETMRTDMFGLSQSAGEIGKAGVELAAYRRESQMLLEARKQHIDLSPAEVSWIKQASVEWANQAEAIRVARERIDMLRQGASDMFSDFLANLHQGQSLWAAFGNAAMAALNKITDKILQMAFDNKLNGLFGSITKLLGIATPGGLANDAAATAAANSSVFAKGGAFDGVSRFAKGGTFTNSVVSTPTLFKFARGGAMGQMGEAGPEAIMPLKRGSDGTLGVQIKGGTDRQRVQVEITDTTGLFDYRVAQHVDEAAPSIMDGATQMSAAKARFAQSRAIRR